MSVGSRLRRWLDVVSSVAVIAVAFLLLWTQVLRPDRTPGRMGEKVAGIPLDPHSITHRLGTANVMLVEFADFECPACAQHFRSTFPQIQRDLIDTGKLSYGFLNYPLERIHPAAFQASEAAECAGSQSKYWEMHARLFSNPKALGYEDLLRHGQALGLDPNLFRTCLAGETAAKVRQDLSVGKRLAVTGTPAFFIGVIDKNGGISITRRITGAAPFNILNKLVEEVTPRQARWPWSWFRQ